MCNATQSSMHFLCSVKCCSGTASIRVFWWSSNIHSKHRECSLRNTSANTKTGAVSTCTPLSLQLRVICSLRVKSLPIKSTTMYSFKEVFSNTVTEREFTLLCEGVSFTSWFLQTDLHCKQRNYTHRLVEQMTCPTLSLPPPASCTRGWLTCCLFGCGHWFLQCPSSPQLKHAVSRLLPLPLPHHRPPLYKPSLQKQSSCCVQPAIEIFLSWTPTGVQHAGILTSSKRACASLMQVFSTSFLRGGRNWDPQRMVVEKEGLGGRVHL